MQVKRIQKLNSVYSPHILDAVFTHTRGDTKVISDVLERQHWH